MNLTYGGHLRVNGWAIAKWPGLGAAEAPLVCRRVHYPSSAAEHCLKQWSLALYRAQGPRRPGLRACRSLTPCLPTRVP
jgi:hypothetical protein